MDGGCSARVGAAVAAVAACLCWVAVGGVSVGAEDASGVPALTDNNGPQSLQSVLYSIEERLRGLDLVYAPRHPTPPPPRGSWDADAEAAVGRRLDAVDARLARVEALLELRLDKIAEAVSGNQMKQSLFNEQITRKLDTLYDRLNQRMHHTESRIDLDVAKMQLSIESGFVRIARGDRDSDPADVDVETQIGELQRQFDGFEATLNATAAAVAELAGRRHEPNDAGNVEPFAAGMENVANKVGKMVADFSQRAQSMEGLVKNAMSLANATRRELQDGLRSLGLRLVYHGNKHTKEKESNFEFGWDALAALMAGEFGNLSNQLSANHNKLVAAQDAFRDSCYRLQEQDQQLSAHIANILDKTLDITDNRSQEVSKRLGTLGEIIKSQASESARRFDPLPRRLDTLHDLVQVIKEQVGELAALGADADEGKEPCADVTQVVRRLAERFEAVVNATRAAGRASDEDDAFRRLEEFGRSGRGNGSDGKSVLDIAEEDLGETLEYNVTEDAETTAARAKESSSDFELGKPQGDGDGDYEEEEDDETTRRNDTTAGPNAEAFPAGDAPRVKGRYAEGDKSSAKRVDIEPPVFSDYWHRSKKLNGSGDDAKVAGGKGRGGEGKVGGGGDGLDLKLSSRVNFNHDRQEYDYDG